MQFKSRRLRLGILYLWVIRPSTLETWKLQIEYPHQEYSKFSLTFDQIAEITKSNTKDEHCSYIDTDFTKCLNNSSFFDCALNEVSSTNMSEMSCSADDLIYDTSLFESTIKSEFRWVHTQWYAGIRPPSYRCCPQKGSYWQENLINGVKDNSNNIAAQ